MGIVRFVHHIQFACKNLWSAYDQLARGFGYQMFCVSHHGPHLNIVLKNGQSMLMLSETGIPTMKGSSTPYAYSLTNKFMKRDRPFDIALEVVDVNEVCSRVKHVSGSNSILLEPVTSTDYHGKVTMAVIQSCLSDVLHTVVDSSLYSGRFMPGYISPEFGLSSTLKRRLNEKPSLNPKTTPRILHLDHVALACNTNHSSEVINWYRDIFEMKKTPVNPLDDDTDGFVIKYGGTGMRLKAVDYASDLVEEGNNCKFVIVEPLEKSTPNQVTRFLTANCSPGIQHVGLSVSDIFSAVQACRSNGVRFLDPPNAYYDELAKTVPLESVQIDFETLRSSGVLIDTEVLNDEQSSNTKKKPHLLQIFTAPLFENDGFFMELIQRHAGACGFGAGNITALWRAVEASPSEQNPRTVKRSVS